MARKNSLLHLLKYPYPAWLLAVITSLYITILFNPHIYTIAITQLSTTGLNDWLFLASIVYFIFFLIHLLSSYFAFGKYTKVWLGLLMVLSATLSYIRNQYNVIFDETMIQNIMETDIHEATELLSPKWLLYIISFGVAPAFLLSRTPLKPQSFHRDLLQRLFNTLILALLLVAIIFPLYPTYASLLRNNRTLKSAVVPSGFIYSLYQYYLHTIPVRNQKLNPLGTDAAISKRLTGKKTVTVMVIGETARASSFSLSGYRRNTNPQLTRHINSKHDIVYYQNFTACGTSTAVSLPCIFSAQTRNDFDRGTAKNSENLLDVFSHAGLEVIWIDNNSGCKGICSRIRHTDIHTELNKSDCNNKNCYDIILATELEKLMQSTANNILVVLHQQGSHGPSYHERVPENLQAFQPACKSNQLQECSHEEIINSYDNTIAYTDFVLANIIDTLDRYSEVRDAMMLYVSDHGESLGENNLYLHGMPYSIAPDEQTHIPALLWMSEGFRHRLGINIECLKDNSSNDYSHDNVFHTMLGILDVHTSIYQDNYDISKPCRTKTT